jgi:eukaryotic-like serine/threonine-protein kinase
MSRTTPGASSKSVLDDDVTVPRVRVAGVGDDEPTNVLLSSSSLEAAPEPLDQAGLDALCGCVISDRYRVDELIGAGGMGAVYRGEQIHLRKRVAIKILRPGAARMPDLVVRFEREAIAGAHVQHPNVVAAIDFGQLEDKSHYLILEYVEGTSLRDIMSEGPLPAERVLTIARQIALALAAVHEKSIVHRDVKPQNILLDTREQVKLLDFGLSKVRVELLSDASRNAKPSAALTGVGTVMGTFSYMAPEAAKGMEAVDARSDLYALGVVMYEMLAGRRPFEEKDPALLFKQQRTQDPPPIHDVAPGVNVPPRVEAVVMRLIQRDPQSRHATANDLVAAIDEVLAPPGREPEKAAVKSVETTLDRAFDKAVEMALDAAPEKTAEATPVKPAEATPVKPAEATPEKPAEAATPEKPAAVPAKAPAKAWPAWLKHPAFLGAAGLLGVGVILLLVLVLRGGSTDTEKAPPVASAAPTAKAAPMKPAALPTEIDGIDVEGWRERMTKAIAKKDWVQGSRAFLAIGKMDPERATGMELRADVLVVVAGIGFETSFPESKEVFDALTNDLGPGGLDVLFHLMRTRGGSKASRRASDILSKPEVMERASPELRIAFELRAATCPDKRALFTRAADEGDQRALDELLIMQQARCTPKRDTCCYKEDEEIKAAISKLRGRLKL